MAQVTIHIGKHRGKAHPYDIGLRLLAYCAMSEIERAMTAAVLGTQYLTGLARKLR